MPSTDKQSESIENQNRVLRQIAERRGWTVAEVLHRRGKRPFGRLVFPNLGTTIGDALWES
jgi:hypothetical protein